MTPLSLPHYSVTLCDNIGLVLLILRFATLFCRSSYCTMCTIHPNLVSFPFIPSLYFHIVQLPNEDGNMHIIEHLVHQICLVIQILSILLFKYSLFKLQLFLFTCIHVHVNIHCRDWSSIIPILYSICIMTCVVITSAIPLLYAFIYLSCKILYSQISRSCSPSVQLLGELFLRWLFFIDAYLHV